MQYSVMEVGGSHTGPPLLEDPNTVWLFTVSMAVKKTMTTASLTRKTFNWSGLLTVSEVQFIIIMAGNMVLRCTARHGAGYILIRKQQEVYCDPRSSLSIGDLRVHPHSDTLPPTKPHLLIVPLPLGGIFFETITKRRTHFLQ